MWFGRCCRLLLPDRQPPVVPASVDSVASSEGDLERAYQCAEEELRSQEQADYVLRRLEQHWFGDSLPWRERQAADQYERLYGRPPGVEDKVLEEIRAAHFRPRAIALGDEPEDEEAAAGLEVVSALASPPPAAAPGANSDPDEPESTATSPLQGGAAPDLASRPGLLEPSDDDEDDDSRPRVRTLCPHPSAARTGGPSSPSVVQEADAFQAAVLACRKPTPLLPPASSQHGCIRAWRGAGVACRPRSHSLNLSRSVPATGGHDRGEGDALSRPDGTAGAHAVDPASAAWHAPEKPRWK